MQLLGDAPGDRLVIGDAGDQGLLAAQIEEHGVLSGYRRSILQPGLAPFTHSAPEPGESG
jgi:hypothetical protein